MRSPYRPRNFLYTIRQAVKPCGGRLPARTTHGWHHLAAKSVPSPLPWQPALAAYSSTRLVDGTDCWPCHPPLRERAPPAQRRFHTSMRQRRGACEQLPVVSPRHQANSLPSSEADLARVNTLFRNGRVISCERVDGDNGLLHQPLKNGLLLEALVAAK